MKLVGDILTIIGAGMVLSSVNLACTKYDLCNSGDAIRIPGAGDEGVMVLP